MVQGVSPVMLIVYDPAPVPLVSLLPEVVGPDEVLQHTPRSVTVPEQSPETVPPVETEVDAAEVKAVVETVGSTEPVVKVLSAP